MAIAQVQLKRTTTVSGTSHAHTVTSTPTDNNLLVAVINFAGGDPGTITRPSGWSLAIEAQRGSAQKIGIYYKVAASEGTSWTWTTANAVQSVCTIYEYSGLDSSQAAVLDKTTSNDGGAGTVTSLSTGTTVATTLADELLAAGIGLTGSSGSAFSWTNSFTDDGTGSAGAGTAVRIVSATGTYETTGSWTTARTAVAAIATFKSLVAGQLAGHGDASSTGAGTFKVAIALAGHGDASTTGQAGLTGAGIARALVGHGDAASAGTGNAKAAWRLAGHGDGAVAGAGVLVGTEARGLLAY